MWIIFFSFGTKKRAKPISRDVDIFFFWVRKIKKKKIKRKNYLRRKKILIASFLKRLQTPSGGET
jgi:hypothetical protein